MKEIKSLTTGLLLGVTTIGIALIMSSCTENARVKRFGGNDKFFVKIKKVIYEPTITMSYLEKHNELLNEFDLRFLIEKNLNFPLV